MLVGVSGFRFGFFDVISNSNYFMSSMSKKIQRLLNAH